MRSSERLTRRDFLKLAGMAAGALVFNPARQEAEEREKNFQGLDSLEVLSVEERRGLIELNDTPVICFPLRDDFFRNMNKPVEVWRLGGIAASFSRIFTLKTPEGQALRVAPLHHTTGIKALPLAVLDEGYAEERSYIPERTYVDSITEPEIADFTMIGEYYPNKQQNLLEASAQFLRHQIAQGEFQSGETYSTLDILNIAGDREFRYGEINNTPVRGAGVCGLATMLAHALSLTNTRFDEHQRHSWFSYYWVGPLDPEVSLDNDAAISRMGGADYDFRWTPSQNFYISLDASMALNGPPLRDGLEGNNIRLVITLSLTSERPNLEAQLEKILRIKQAYDDYNIRGIDPEPVIREGRLEESFSAGESEYHERMYKAVRNEEDREGFEEEITYDPLIKDILAVQILVERYMQEYPYSEFQERHEKYLGEYIRESEWFSGLDEEIKSNLTYALGNLNSQTWRFETQVTQCVAWVIFLSALRRANSPIDISGWDINYARDMIPPELRGGAGPGEIHRWPEAPHYISTERLGDFEPGDLFVTQSVPFDQGAGHVGVLVAKKVLDGKVNLLVSDANRGFDGRVRLFKVDSTNKYAIFGRPPLNWVGVRRGNV